MILIALKVGHHRPASKMPFKWRFAGQRWPYIECWLGSFFRGSGPVLLFSKEPHIYVILQGVGVRTPCPPSGSEHGEKRHGTLTVTRQQDSNKSVASSSHFLSKMIAILERKLRTTPTKQ